MNKIVTTIFLLTLISTFSFSQEQLSISYFGYSIRQHNLEKINDTLKIEIMPELDEQLNSIAFENLKLNKNLVFISAFSFSSGNTKDFSINNVDYKSRIKSSMAFSGKIGYTFLKNNSFIFYPTIGLDISITNLSIAEKKSINFENAISNLNNEINLDRTDLLLDFGFGADYMFNFDYFENDRFFSSLNQIAIGIKGGYLIPIAEFGNWEGTGLEILDFDDESSGGGYITFNAGLWN